MVFENNYVIVFKLMIIKIIVFIISYFIILDDFKYLYCLNWFNKSCVV